jgi:predicted amidohydrolase
VTQTNALTVAVWQADGPQLDVPAALSALDNAADEAARSGARLLVCPELTLTGYDIGHVAADVAEPDHGRMMQAVVDVARRHGIAVAYSYPERAGSELFIAAALVDRDGHVLARYRKSHLYGVGEAAVYTPGRGDVVVADLDGFRVGLLVCYDVEFPEQVRRLALAGVDLLAVPTALMRPYDAVSTMVVPTRSFENQIAIAYANRCGVENDLEFCGLSCIVGPDGVELARAGRQPGVHLARITAEDLRVARVHNTHLADRRPDLYVGLTEPIHARSNR